ncbi:hypothetical protein HDU83_008446 [Entophlyctis luteolus]|nr:hypothetical protein HDU83_008446 [Entophlyctis luteolus]
MSARSSRANAAAATAATSYTSGGHSINPNAKTNLNSNDTANIRVGCLPSFLTGFPSVFKFFDSSISQSPQSHCKACSRLFYPLDNSASASPSPTSAASSVAQRLPVRLLHLPTSTILQPTKHLCYDCLEKAHDYAIVSHVWGEVRPFSRDVLGLSEHSDMTWRVPLKSVQKLSLILSTARGLSFSTFAASGSSARASTADPRDPVSSDSSRNIEFLWMDVLCMDQDLGASKPQPELIRMGDYYRNAAVCLAFLEDTPNSTLRALSDTGALEAVENADRVLRKEFFHVDAAVLPVATTARILVNLSMVVKSEWFTRVWTFQELGTPKSILFFGYDEEHNSDRNQGDINARSHQTFQGIGGHVLSRYGRIANSRRLKTRYDEQLGLTASLEKTITRINELRDLRDAAIGSARLQAADLLRLVHTRKCLFSRDKILGTISLLPYASLMSLNGVTTSNQAFCSLLHAALQAGDWSILGFKVPGQDNRSWALGIGAYDDLETSPYFYAELGLVTCTPGLGRLVAAQSHSNDANSNATTTSGDALVLSKCVASRILSSEQVVDMRSTLLPTIRKLFQAAPHNSQEHETPLALSTDQAVSQFAFGLLPMAPDPTTHETSESFNESFANHTRLTLSALEAQLKTSPSDKILVIRAVSDILILACITSTTAAAELDSGVHATHVVVTPAHDYAGKRLVLVATANDSTGPTAPSSLPTDPELLSSMPLSSQSPVYRRLGYGFTIRYDPAIKANSHLSDITFV